ncbi:MAG TPA: hypothetical protein ENK47_04965 [Euryarchaeota archaeon]|nr:hypothetical protein [Euryarchaeota archaeon]
MRSGPYVNEWALFANEVLYQSGINAGCLCIKLHLRGVKSGHVWKGKVILDHHTFMCRVEKNIIDDTYVQNMIHLYQNIYTLKVLSHFFSDPYTGFYLREIARYLDMSPMTVKRALELLEKDGLIERYNEKNLTLFKLNIKDNSTRYLKISFNLSLLRDSGYIEELLESGERIHSIILYGSYSRGTDGPDSDIDILIISSSKKAVEYKSRIINGRGLSIIRMTPSKWKEQAKTNRAFYLEIMRDGIPVHGDIPVIE